MSSLREKMKEEMVLVGLAQSTQDRYLYVVTHLQKYYDKSPDKLSEEEIRGYLLYLLNDKKFSPNSYNVHIYALRFFYCVTLRQPLRKLDLPRTKVTYKLPDILNSDEVQEIIKATDNIKYRTLLITIYGTGLRMSEALNLRMKDIDSHRMTLHIRNAKGGKDRYVILSPVVHQALQRYWKACRFVDYVFPSKNNQHKPLTSNSVSRVFKSSKARAGVTKKGGVHSFRTAFATHLLESGADIFAIKELLGHASIQSTARYLEFVPHRHKNLTVPIERLKL